MSQTLLFFFSFVAVLALIGLAAWLVRRFATNRLGANTNRGRMPRLAVIDAAAVDNRRRLVLVRRDNIEHLLMIGGPTDIVVEANIVRAMPGRESVAQRPAVGNTEPAPRIAPLPDSSWSDGEAARADMFDQAEPQLPEPPPRPVRPSFADELRRPAPPPMPERRPERAERIERAADPLAGFAPEPIAGRPEPRPEPMPSRVTARSEPMMPRPPRPELPKAPPRAAERVVAPPPPPPVPPPAPVQSSADQNLAEMAQRLEAALRRPAGETMAPPVAPEPPQGRSAPRSEPTPPPAPAPAKTGFENLEDEMASLLGRPKTPS